PARFQVPGAGWREDRAATSYPFSNISLNISADVSDNVSQHWCIGFHIAHHRFAQDVAKQFGWQPVAWPHAAHGGFRNRFASPQVFDKIQRPSKLHIALLTGLATVVNLTHGLPGCARALTKRGHFRGFQREAVVWSAAVAIKGEMLFDDGGAQ